MEILWFIEIVSFVWKVNFSIEVQNVHRLSSFANSTPKIAPLVTVITVLLPKNWISDFNIISQVKLEKIS